MTHFSKRAARNAEGGFAMPQRPLAASCRGLTLPLLVLLAAAVAGCSGEWPQATAYVDGEYRGKPDNLPWQSAPFNGNEHEWQKAIDARTMGQNEYARIENQ